MPIRHVVGKLPDQTIIALFEELEAQCGVGSCTYQISDVNVENAELAILKRLKTSSYSISNATFATPSNKITLNIPRTVNGQVNAHYDEIAITVNPNRGGTASDALAVDKVVRSKIRFPRTKEDTSTGSSNLGLLEQEVASLAALHEKMISEALELRTRIEFEHSEQRTAIETRRTAIENEILDKEKAAFERIAAEQAALDKKLGEFDITDHMRARRKLREDISAQVQEFLVRPQTSLSTRAKFMLLMMVAFSASVGAGLFAYESFQAFLSQANSATQIASETLAKIIPPQAQVTPEMLESAVAKPAGFDYLLWMLALRGAVSTAVAIGFAVYAMNLLKRSHDEEVHTMRELQRYGMDINRASWIIETAMEMTTKEGAVLPERWVEGACYGLFRSDSKADGEVSSLAALGAVMGLGPEVTVGPTGASFKIPPKAAKKASNEG